MHSNKESQCTHPWSIPTEKAGDRGKLNTNRWERRAGNTTHQEKRTVLTQCADYSMGFTEVPRGWRTLSGGKTQTISTTISSQKKKVPSKMGTTESRPKTWQSIQRLGEDLGSVVWAKIQVMIQAILWGKAATRAEEKNGLKLWALVKWDLIKDRRNPKAKQDAW